MTEKRRSELKKILDARRRELEVQVTNKVRAFREADSEKFHGALADVVDHPSNDEVEFALAQMQSQSIDKIKVALNRLAGGDYGICHDCDEEIPEKRLRALPFATRCHACQESAEQTERRRQIARDVPFRSGVGKLSYESSA